MSKKQYRLLSVGEYTRIGDEFYQSNKEWTAIKEAGWPILINYVPHRRPLESSPDLTAARAEIERLTREKEIVEHYFANACLVRDDNFKRIQHLESELAAMRAEWEKLGPSQLCKLRGCIDKIKPKQPPAPAFVVDKPGVYRRRDGFIECVELKGIANFPFTWKASGHADSSTRQWQDNGKAINSLCESVYDLVAYLAPLPPPEAGTAFEAQPGKPLPRKFWCYSLCGVSFGEWEIGTNPAKCEGNEHWLYAECREPKPTAKTQTIIAAPQRDGWVTFVGVEEAGT